MSIQTLYDRDGKQCIDSTLIGGFQIKKHSSQHGTKYRLMGWLRRDYGALDLPFGLFDTMPDAQEFMGALARQIEAEG